jgi:5-methylcytosine-specific restriction protein A
MTHRIRGRKLQQRRLRIWSQNPCCAKCDKLTTYPNGFELDHKVALDNGGPDTDENCQVLCVARDKQGNKTGCHVDKTAKDMGYKERVKFDEHGRVVW